MPYTPTNWIESSTKLGPTNLNNLESGVSKAPYGPDASTSNVPIWNGSSWTYGLIANANVSATAAIAKSKLAALNIANADVAAGAAIAVSKLADPGSGNVVTSAGAGAVAAKPPGYEIGYDQITVTFNVIATTLGTATTAITGSAYTFDGSPVIAEFFAPWVRTPNILSQFVFCVLFESGTAIAMSETGTPAAANLYVPGTLKFRFTPSAGSHTYSIKAFATSTTGTPQIGAGTGTAGADAPAFLRFTKV